MIKEKAHIFIDEFGTNVYLPNHNTTTSHFVYTSIIISDSNLSQARELREKLSKKYKQGSVLSSKTFDKKDKNNSLQKRIDFLRELTQNLDFTIDVLVIDKSKITSDNIRKKEVFYRYFQNLFVGKYNERYESFEINADKIGSTDFALELATYINKNNIDRDLFNPDRYFRLCDDSIEEPLIQIADMVCGSLGKFYSPSHYHEKADEIFEIFHTRISANYFPKFEYDLPSNFIENHKSNSKIREIALNSLNFDKSKIKDSELAVRIIDFFLSHFKANPKRFIQTYELESYLKNFVNDIKTEKIRRIIRDLRYEGVFIISISSQNGYKIANDLNDIYEYFDHYSNYFIPMFKKIQIINQEISNDTFNEINILEKDPNFIKFKKLLHVIELMA